MTVPAFCFCVFFFFTDAVLFIELTPHVAQLQIILNGKDNISYGNIQLMFIRLDLLGTAPIYINFLQLEIDKRDKSWAFFVEKQALRFFILFWHQAKIMNQIFQLNCKTDEFVRIDIFCHRLLALIICLFLYEKQIIYPCYTISIETQKTQDVSFIDDPKHNKIWLGSTYCNGSWLYITVLIYFIYFFFVLKENPL